VPRRTISDMDIVKVVAEAFNVPVNRVIDRLEGMDYAALRRQWTMGG
jgi:hypothetical protein